MDMRAYVSDCLPLDQLLERKHVRVRMCVRMCVRMHGVYACVSRVYVAYCTVCMRALVRVWVFCFVPKYLLQPKLPRVQFGGGLVSDAIPRLCKCAYVHARTRVRACVRACVRA